VDETFFLAMMRPKRRGTNGSCRASPRNRLRSATLSAVLRNPRQRRGMAVELFGESVEACVEAGLLDEAAQAVELMEREAARSGERT
jgi:hypothetical protein